MSQRSTLPRQAKNSAPNTPTSSTPSSADIRDLVQSNREVLISVRSLKEEFEGFRKSFASLEAKVDRFESSLASLAKRQSECATEVKDIKTDLETLKQSQFNLTANVLEEVEQRERRRNNIMIFGLPEQPSGSLSERQDHDIQSITNLLRDAGVSDVTPEQSRRIGRIVEGRPRPLKVKLENQETMHRILRCSKNLRDCSAYKEVFITSDATRMQQEEMKKLRLELRRRRELGEDVVIFNQQIRTKTSLTNFRN